MHFNAPRTYLLIESWTYKLFFDVQELLSNFEFEMNEIEL